MHRQFFLFGNVPYLEPHEHHFDYARVCQSSKLLIAALILRETRDSNNKICDVAEFVKYEVKGDPFA